jgi:hypothetical protein
MTDDITKKVVSLAERAPRTGSPVDEGGVEDEDMEEDLDEGGPIGDDFRELFGETEALRTKLLRLAQTKQETGGVTEANILRVMAGDLLPLLADLIATCGASFEEVSEGLGGGGGHEGLDMEDAVQLYVTIQSNLALLRNISGSTPDEGVRQELAKLMALNESGLALLRDNYGDGIEEAATEVLTTAVNS